ncbi:MAG: DUF4270 family protein, partial [Saprospiraceae bacterium]
FSDTTTIRATTVTKESEIVYTDISANQPTNYLFGKVDSPIFGIAESSIYSEIRMISGFNSSSQGSIFDSLAVATFDSLVLSLEYDSVRTYGDTLLPQSLEIFRLSENMDNDATYYSDQDFTTFATPIGSISNFLPHPKQPYDLIEPKDVSEFDTTSVRTLRIPLDPALGMEIMNYDSTTFANSENFLTMFNGIKIVPNSSNETLLGFTLNSVQTYMKLYYQLNGESKSIRFVIDGLSTKFNHFDHDYTGSLAESYIDDSLQGENLIFSQGMSGLRTKIEFPYIQNLGDVAINKAELELIHAFDVPMNDTELYEEPVRLVLSYENEDGETKYITDFNAALSVGDLSYFGGDQTEEDDNGTYIKKYRMNLSSYIQDVIENSDGDLTNDAIYVDVYLKNQFANWGVFYGTQHPQYRAKLNLTYTPY